MRDVLVVAYRSRSDALDLAEQVTRHLALSDATVATYLVDDDSVPPSVTATTLVISLGGDGTFLRAARIAHQGDAEVLGVNLGRVGFLLGVSPEFLLDEIDAALAGQLRSERRVALRVTSVDAPVNEFCLNEVVVERSETGRMVRVTTYIDSDEFLTYSADGVMVATATGSTGYNFSAGGPVISPELNVLVMTPIAPHFTIDRSIVVGSHQPIRLRVLDRDAIIVADGKPVGTLRAGQSVDVTYDPRGVQVIGAEKLGLGTRLRQSLREGHA